MPKIAVMLAVLLLSAAVMGADGKPTVQNILGNPEVSLQQTNPAQAEQGDAEIDLSGNGCPPGFAYRFTHGRPTGDVSDPYEPSCYRFATEQRSWIDSRRQCQALGGDLVSIETAGEQHHMQVIIRAIPKFQTPAMTIWNHWGYWTSGTDAPREGSWNWAATGSSVGYTNWSPGQPDNNFEGGLSENCMTLHGSWSWKWNDAICYTDMNSYICEKAALKLVK